VSSWRCGRVLVTIVLVLVTAVMGVLAGASVESEAAGLPGPQAARGGDFTPFATSEGSPWSWGADMAGQLGDGILASSTAAVHGVTVGPVASYTFTNVTGDRSISASFAAVAPHTITASAGANGSISPRGAVAVADGADQTFTITADPGYSIAGVLVDGVTVGPVASYTFTNVTGDRSISASFAAGVQTRLSLSVGKAIVTYGSSTLLTGVLYDSGDPLHEVGMGDWLVTMQSASSATGHWVDLETLTTSSVAGSVGACELTVTPTASTYYRLRFVAGLGSGYGGSLSLIVRVGVRPVLGTPKVPAAARVGRSFHVYGTLIPKARAGQKTVAIKVYRYKKRRWVLVRQVLATNADSGGNTRYGVKVKLFTKGRYRFRAYTAPTATLIGTSTSLSQVLTVR